MAEISQILSLFWLGAEWQINGDDYSTLEWYPSNAGAKPSETEIRARSEEADVALADLERKSKQQAAMRDAPDYMLRGFEIMLALIIEQRRVINNMRNTIVAQAHTGDFTPWDDDVVNLGIALRQKLLDIRNAP